MNPFKSTIFLANYDYFWEPIILNKKIDNQKIFNYNDSIIKKLLNIEVKYYEEIKLNKIFAYDNPKDIISKEENKLIEKEENKIIDKKDINNIFISEIEEIDLKKLNKAKLNKMKLNDLIILLKKLDENVDLENKKSKKKIITKNELIELILNFINN